MTTEDFAAALPDFNLIDVRLIQLTAEVDQEIYANVSITRQLSENNFNTFDAVLKIKQDKSVDILHRETGFGNLGFLNGMMPRVPGPEGRRDIIVARNIPFVSDTRAELIRMSPNGEISKKENGEIDPFYSADDLAACTGNSEFGVNFDNGLAFSANDPNGKLYFVDKDSEAVYQIDMADGEATSCSELVDAAAIQAVTGVEPNFEGAIAILQPAP